MMKEELNFDICVVGGGLAGLFAAVAAARCGAKVALVQDRSVLGGNASTEIAVGIAGADCSGGSLVRYARETGLINEYMLEILHRSSDLSSARPLFSVVMWEMVKSESNCSLFLNTYAHQPQTNEKGEFVSILAIQTNTEKEYEISAKVFIDCTGHGSIGYAAGAEFRMGREGKDEFGESMAPEHGDNKTMGDSIIFRAKDMGRPVPYAAPDWAEKFPTDEDLPHRHPTMDTIGEGEIAGFWWLEYGGEKNTIKDAQEIHEQLTRILFGLWDHMKNTGDHGVDNYAITHIDIVPGRRESRRLMGDSIVNENDLRKATLFGDRIAYAGWPIDLHPPGGVYSPDPPCTHVYIPQVWNIPFGSIYSKNIPNLMFAGRDISVSHIALGSSRVMGTCAVIGQAAGTAAAMCCRDNISPKGLSQTKIDELQQQLLKDNCYLFGMGNEDPNDLASDAIVTASSQHLLDTPEVQDFYLLDSSCAQMFPVSGDFIDTIELFIKSESSDNLTLKLNLHKAENINDFTGTEPISVSSAAIAPDHNGWVSFEFKAEVEPNRFYWVSLQSNPLIRWAYQRELVFATNCAFRRSGDWLQWRAFKREPSEGRFLRTFCFRVTPNPKPYQPENVVSGVGRPERWTNIWVSDSLQTLPQHIDLNFSQLRKINEVRLTFDDDLDSNIYHPEPYGRIGSPDTETLIRDYKIHVRSNNKWTQCLEVTGNYQRFRIHEIGGIEADAIRIECVSTYGTSQARIYEVRVY